MKWGVGADLARGGVSFVISMCLVVQDLNFDSGGGSYHRSMRRGLGFDGGVNGVHCNLAGMGGFASSRDLTIDVCIAIRWDGGLGRFRLEWCFNFAIQ